jgi:hypothetical protein
MFPSFPLFPSGQPPWKALPELSARWCVWPAHGLHVHKTICVRANLRTSPACRPRRLAPSERAAAGARATGRRRCPPAADWNPAISACPYHW